MEHANGFQPFFCWKSYVPCTNIATSFGSKVQDDVEKVKQNKVNAKRTHASEKTYSKNIHAYCNTRANVTYVPVLSFTDTSLFPPHRA